MSKYLCKNYGSCTKADAREPIELIPGTEPLCEECTFKLEPIDDGSRANPAPKKYIAAAAAVLVIAAIGGWYLLPMSTKGKPEPSISAAPAKGPTGLTPDEKSLSAQKQEADKKILEASGAGADSVQKTVIAREYVKAAVALMQRGNWKDAEEQLGKAKAENPEEPLIYYNQAIIHLKQGRDAEAMAALETSFQKGFKDFTALESDGDLKALTAKPEFVAIASKYKGK